MKQLKKLTLTLLLVSATFLSGLATPLAADATVRTHRNAAPTTVRRAVRPQLRMADVRGDERQSPSLRAAEP